jgi:hypothetical protein
MSLTCVYAFPSKGQAAKPRVTGSEIQVPSRTRTLWAWHDAASLAADRAEARAELARLKIGSARIAGFEQIRLFLHRAGRGSREPRERGPPQADRRTPRRPVPVAVPFTGA